MATETFIVPELEELATNYSASKAWSDVEEQTLRSYYGRVSNRDIAKHLDRSVSGVEHKIRRLDLGGE